MSLDNLPVEWLTTSIENIAEIVAGGTPKANDPENFVEPPNGIGWLTPADLSGYTNKYIGHGKRDLSEKGYNGSSAKLMPKGSVVFSSRAPIGYVAIASNEISTNQGFKNFVIDENISSEYLYYYLKSIRDLAESLGTGTTFKELSGSACKKLPFVLAPLAEQQEIVRQLDVMLTQVKQIKARLDAIPAILKKFRQSVLAEAVSGKLTAIIDFSRDEFYDFVDELIKLNKKNENIEVKEFSEYKSNWKDAPLSLLVDQDRGIPYGIVQTGDDTDGGINTIRCGDILPFTVRTSNLKRVDKNIEKNYLRTRLRGGEVILAIRGSVGNAAVVTRDLVTEPLNISREVAMIPVTPKLDPYYLTIFLQSPSGKQALIEQTRGVAQKGINLDDLRKLYIPLPTIDEQRLIVEKVDNLFGLANHIEEVIGSAQKRVNLLTQSILAKAFSGELTAVWREQHQHLITGDNSAEALLAKIQADRSESFQKTKQTITRKKRVVKEVIEPISVMQALTNFGKPLNSYDLFIAANYPTNSETELVEQFYIDLRSSIENGKVLEKSSEDGQPYFELNN